MAHLRNFGVGNFRVFKEIHNFQFTPITILTGTNSSGKSSLIKALLLIKDAFEKSFNYQIESYAYLMCEKIGFPQQLNLGNFSTVVNRISGSEIVTIILPFDLFPKSTFPCFMHLEYIQGNTLVKNMRLKSMLIKDKHQKVLVRLEMDGNSYSNTVSFSGFYKMFLRHDQDVAVSEMKANINENSWFSQPKLIEKPLLNYLFLENLDWIADHVSIIYGHLSTDKQLDLFNLAKQVKEGIELIANKEQVSPTQLLINWELSYLDNLYEKSDLWGITNPLYVVDRVNSFFSFDELEEPSVYLRPWVKDYVEKIKEQFPLFCNEFIVKPEVWKRVKRLKNENDYHSDNYFFERLVRKFNYTHQSQKSSFESIEYVSSVRTKVDRIYRIGSKESNLHELLLEYLDTEFDSGAIGWMTFLVNHLGIADKLEVKPTEDSAGAKIILTKDGKSAELADFGYGIAQLIPILLRIHLVINKAIPLDEEPDRSPHPYTIILEEPETNLHPNLQSKLADVFIECQKRLNIQFIIETHSEYLIRRLQRRTAEFYNEKRKNDLSIPTSFTNIYYFYPPDNVPEGERQVYPINIQQDGALTKNFGTGFFDEAGNEDLLLYQIAKHNKN